MYITITPNKATNQPASQKKKKKELEKHREKVLRTPVAHQ